MKSDSVTHVIWDWNGTLMNDAHFSVSVVNQLLAARKLPAVTVEFYRSVYTHPVKNMYQRFGFDLEREDWSALSDEWHNLYCGGAAMQELHDDALQTLELFEKRGYVQSILSALPHDILLESIAHNHLDKFFHTVSGLGDRLGISKVDNGHLLMQKLGAPPERTVVIGDSTHDAEVAAALGSRCILVHRGLEDEQRLRQNGVPVVGDFAALVTLL